MAMAPVPGPTELWPSMREALLTPKPGGRCGADPRGQASRIVISLTMPSAFSIRAFTWVSWRALFNLSCSAAGLSFIRSSRVLVLSAMPAAIDSICLAPASARAAPSSADRTPIVVSNRLSYQLGQRVAEFDYHVGEACTYLLKGLEDLCCRFGQVFSLHDPLGHVCKHGNPDRRG